jgi:hypothetical protein
MVAFDGKIKDGQEDRQIVCNQLIGPDDFNKRGQLWSPFRPGAEGKKEILDH